MVLDSYGCCSNLIKGEHPTIKKGKRKGPNNATTNPPVCRVRRNQIIPHCAQSLKSVFYSFHSSGWGDTVPLINLCEGQRENEMMPTFSYFTKTCLKLQYGICSPRQMHIKWNWTMNSWLLSVQCLKGKYITNEFHREKIWTFSITVIPIESLSQIAMKLNPIFQNRYSAKKAAFLESSLKWSQNYIMRKKIIQRLFPIISEDVNLQRDNFSLEINVMVSQCSK